MKIYTRTGDGGSTGLFSGERVPKTDPRIEACGAVDELNSHLGAAVASNPADPVGDDLRRVQGELFALGAQLASPGGSDCAVGQDAVAWLEGRIDAMTAEIAPLKNFILPGGSPGAAQIHIARAVCRRAERRVIALADAAPSLTVVYLNRLSDFLFTLARYENHLRGIAEPKWLKAD